MGGDLPELYNGFVAIHFWKAFPLPFCSLLKLENVFALAVRFLQAHVAESQLDKAGGGGMELVGSSLELPWGWVARPT